MIPGPTLSHKIPPPVHKLPRHTGLRRSTGPPLRTPSLRSSPLALTPTSRDGRPAAVSVLPGPQHDAPAWLETLAFLFLSRKTWRWKGDSRNSQTGTQVSPTERKLETARPKLVCISHFSYYLVSFFFSVPEPHPHPICIIVVLFLNFFPARKFKFSRHRIPHMSGAFRRSRPKQILGCYS